MSAKLPSAPIDPENSLSRYLRHIRTFPMLDAEEEYMLAKRWKEHGDAEAAAELVTSHLRLVAKIARGYQGYGLPFGEIISEGNVGLMQAVKRFDPEKGFRSGNLCPVVDPRLDPGIHPQILVAREDRNHGRAEEAFLQSPPAEERDQGHRGGRSRPGRTSARSRSASTSANTR